jgi:hypothetical protein
VPRITATTSRAVVSALAALVAVTACGPVHSGAAATVGHTRISVAQVRAATKASLAGGGPGAAPAADSPDAERAALTTLIRDDLLVDAAASRKVTVSEGDVQDFLSTLRQTNGSDENTAKNNNIPFSSLHQVAYEGLLVDKLEKSVAPGQTDQTALQTALTNYLVALAKQRGVTVSPRYGAFNPDPHTFGVVAADGFSTPFKSPIAVPSS